MVISTYQLNTVLRVYGNQLRQGRISPHTNTGQSRSPDSVNIAAGSKRDAVVEKVVSGMMDRIADSGPRNPDETTAFRRLEQEFGQGLILSRKNGNQFQFKAVSDTANTAIDIPAKTSDNLVERLNTYLADIVSQNMVA
ncbi:MAG: hypothetical protein K9K63_02010 [Desulfotignum sp.]|nr:hypothetical protein [Desulfotignum sp.]MCF8087661.1 hypothetical protein [Desulfotignum sp.]MCF8136067.1 hypothetical protein [Desulfotignum sp.]